MSVRMGLRGGNVFSRLSVMGGMRQIVRRSKLGSEEGWDRYWLSKSPAERIQAVGIINLTINGEKYAEQEFSRVCQVTRRSRC